MKQTFTKYFGRITEKLDLGLEEKWIYVHYTKGTFEKTACILKNTDKPQEEYLASFFKENGVSEAMKKEVEKFFINVIDTSGTAEWKEFVNFLLKILSVHVVIGITVGLAVYSGYKLGDTLDERYNLFPLLTLIGTFLGIGIGGLAGYTMIYKYVMVPDENGKKKKHIKNTSTRNKQQDEKQYSVIDVTLEDVRKSIREFAASLPKGVYRTILVKDDNSIDFKQLAPLLGGFPSKKYYMSKETYDLFEECEKQIPFEMDLVQKAVDQYVKDHKEYPMLKFDPHHRVNYYQLIQDHYLKSAPEIQFYITDLDGLVTHVQPRKNKTSS